MNNISIKTSRLYLIVKKLYYSLLSPKQVAARIYYVRFGKHINWAKPRDLNEKINWLKFYSDTSKWTECSDKYAVRDYVRSKGLEDILLPIYGKWDKASDIDLSELPESFVLKTNHGSGSIVIVKDKHNCDENKIKEDMSHWLSEPFGKSQGEPHYMDIKPCVIAEHYLEPNHNFSMNSIVDYKIWCFGGEPYYIWTCYNRTADSVYVDLYDCNWNLCQEKQVFTSHYKNGNGAVPKPANLSKMLEIARILSQGFPQVRVDLYEHNKKIYFGEMTFTSNGGYMDFYTQDFLNELGDLVELK